MRQNNVMILLLHSIQAFNVEQKHGRAQSHYRMRKGNTHTHEKNETFLPHEFRCSVDHCARPSVHIFRAIETLSLWNWLRNDKRKSSEINRSLCLLKLAAIFMHPHPQSPHMTQVCCGSFDVGPECMWSIRWDNNAHSVDEPTKHSHKNSISNFIWFHYRRSGLVFTHTHPYMPPRVILSVSQWNVQGEEQSAVIRLHRRRHTQDTTIVVVDELHLKTFKWTWRKSNLFNSCVNVLRSHVYAGLTTNGIWNTSKYVMPCHRWSRTKSLIKLGAPPG